MTSFQVDRTQFPIGQGGFHSTVINTSHGCLSMVVDCGGSTAEHRGLLLDAFAQGRRQHDILAISHFDEDHINGVEAMHGAGIEFKAVFLPHVETKDYLMWMTLKLSSVTSNDELAHIVMIGGQLYGGHFGPVVRVGPPGPVASREQVRDRLDEDGNLNDMLTDEANEAVRKARGQHGQIFSSSQSLSFKRIDWLIRFYSREWIFPDEVRAIWDLPFLAKLKAVVNRTTRSMSPAEWALFATDLQLELASKVPPSGEADVKSLISTNLVKADTRLKLQKLARSIRSSVEGLSCKNVLSQLYEISESLEDYNDASMCLYSGPAQRGTGARRELFSRSVHLGHRAVQAQKLDGVHTRDVGWMATGDADFSTPSKVQEFLRHYHTETALTSVFVLPHHGSKMSYDSKMDRLRELIANLSDKPLFIAPANPEHKKYHHPHWPVESTCRKSGDFFIVDQDLESFYGESVRTARQLSGLVLLD